MKKILFLLATIIPLTACAGSAYRLPQVSNTDIQAMQSKIAENKAPLKTYERSDSQYKAKLAGITKRLVKNARPLCNHAGYASCYFETRYDSGDTINAYASDGHKITIYRGLLQYLKNEDEMAAVVSHEMGHHLAKHNQETQQNAATGAAISGILTAVLIGAANSNNPYYSAYDQQRDQQTLEDMMVAGAQIGAISYSKEQEREADLLATYLLSRAGYNLKRAQNIMLVLSKTSGEPAINSSAFLDTHPAGIERIVAWEKAIDEIKGNTSKLPYLKDEPAQTSREKNMSKASK